MKIYQTNNTNVKILVHGRESVARLEQREDGVRIRMIEFQPSYTTLSLVRYPSFEAAQEAVEERLAEVGSIIGRRTIF